MRPCLLTRPRLHQADKLDGIEAGGVWPVKRQEHQLDDRCHLFAATGFRP